MSYILVYKQCRHRKIKSELKTVKLYATELCKHKKLLERNIPAFSYNLYAHWKYFVMFRCYAWRCSGLILFFRKIFIVRIPFWEWEWLNEGLSSSYLRISFYSHLTLLILKIIFAVFFFWTQFGRIFARLSFAVLSKTNTSSFHPILKELRDTWQVKAFASLLAASSTLNHVHFFVILFTHANVINMDQTARSQHYCMCIASF